MEFLNRSDTQWSKMTNDTRLVMSVLLNTDLNVEILGFLQQDEQKKIFHELRLLLDDGQLVEIAFLLTSQDCYHYHALTILGYDCGTWPREIQHYLGFNHAHFEHPFRDLWNKTATDYALYRKNQVRAGGPPMVPRSMQVNPPRLPRWCGWGGYMNSDWNTKRRKIS